MGPGARERRRGRGRGGVFLLSLQPGSVLRLPLPPSLLSSPQRRRTRLARREGSQLSASEASGTAGNSGAPARCPAPGLGPAPPRGSGGDRGSPARRGSLLRSAGPSPELTGASPTRALRLPRPHGLSVGKESPPGAALRPRGWRLSCQEPRASPGFPERWTPSCHLAPDRGQSAATAPVGRRLAPIREKNKASSERVVTTAGQGCAPRTRGFRAAER